MHYILKDKKPVKAELLEWGEWMHTHQEESKVGRTNINGYLVSTIFLGLNLSFTPIIPDKHPLIFETMVFKGKEIFYDYTRRYYTWGRC